ncbi:hypothetical protein [Helcococcus ovis]|nr:hypothetical protein [Helcococcus ovis]
MINRSYLPYKSAREYVDRGMAKWMGFFLAEHTVALNSTDCGICFDDRMDEEEKLFFLSSAFINKLEILLYTTRQKEPFLGVISDMNDKKLYLTTDEKIFNFTYEEILKLRLTKVDEDE